MVIAIVPATATISIRFVSMAGHRYMYMPTNNCKFKKDRNVLCSLLSRTWKHKQSNYIES